MATTIFVIGLDSGETRWIESTLASTGSIIVSVEDGAALSERLSRAGTACLIASAESGEPAILDTIRELRANGTMLPVIVLGPHSAFRTAVEIARLPATDFLERPVSARQLRAAVRRALQGAT